MNCTGIGEMQVVVLICSGIFVQQAIRMKWIAHGGGHVDYRQITDRQTFDPIVDYDPHRISYPAISRKYSR